MSMKEAFEKAVAESKLLPARPDNDTLLRLYSYFKQATEGNAPDNAPSNPFDIVARAKYQAWEALYGMDTETAMKEYTELVNKLKG
ncbi:MAG: acyl-CoA-binding protein [Taibaiella sp.]|nr:acyl-CoA-binding protein [Taibaiella sp.]